MRFISIKGARQNNLRDISCEIPKGQLTVVTGPSGSGKSSLAFDTLFAEAQRRYTESLSPSARQFVERLPRPDVDSVEGLSPALALRQTAPVTGRHARVGSQTEINDFLRLLFARAGTSHCPVCDRSLNSVTTGQLVEQLCRLPNKTRLILNAPIPRSKEEPVIATVERLLARGFVRGRIGGQDFDFADIKDVPETNDEPLYVTIDRIVIKDEIRSRLMDSVELGLMEGGGSLLVTYPETNTSELFSNHPQCPEHLQQLPALEPRHFSPNSPAGACQSCEGSGQTDSLNLAMLFPAGDLSLREGACAAFGPPGSVAQAVYLNQAFKGLSELDTTKPWVRLAPNQVNEFLYGAKTPTVRTPWRGLLHWLENTDYETDESPPQGALGNSERSAFLRVKPCESCAGTGLGKIAQAVSWRGHRLHNLLALPMQETRRILQSLASKLTAQESYVAKPPIDAALTRLSFLCDVGLGYLSLTRPIKTLSAGEAQRVNLSSLLGAQLEGALYVLDEPTAGLHPQDRRQVLDAVKRLVGIGNTVVLVEHSREAILEADHILDLGPGAGALGGRLVASGSPEQLKQNPTSVTGAHLRNRGKEKRDHSPLKRWLEFGPIHAHNVHGAKCKIPRGCMTVITGRSGAGKSSLAISGILPIARQALSRRTKERPPDLAYLERVISVDQAPIGRSSRSTPASYCGLFTPLRELLAATPEAKARGYRSARFSYNKKGGRCEACRGEGSVRVRMQFLPDVFVPCEVCRGSRYEPATLEVRYRGHSVADILALTVNDAEKLLSAHPKIAPGLRTLREVGLGYITLGQSATTLSGGEAQRIKLAAALARGAATNCLCVLDEPCSGLHFTDVLQLNRALLSLRDEGATLVVVEHNPTIVEQADWVLEIGPGPGDAGGQLVYAGPPGARSTDPV